MIVDHHYSPHLCSYVGTLLSRNEKELRPRGCRLAWLVSGTFLHAVSPAPTTTLFAPTPYG